MPPEASPALSRSPLLRVGLIGTGFVARRAHLPAWSALGARMGAEVTALCDLDAAALAAAAPLAPSARTFGDARELFASEVDAVTICASNAAHFPLALAALRAGKHVLCEKPLGISAREAELLGAEADARGLVLMAHHQLRFTAEARAARDFMRAGGLGPVHHARVTALRRASAPTLPGFTDRALSGGGALLDLGVHALDLALWLMDFPRATRVSGSARAAHAGGARIKGRWGDWDRARFDVEDFAAGLVHFENGATLVLESAWLGHYPEEGLSCALFGEAASLHWPSGEVISQGNALERVRLPAPPEDAGDGHLAAIRAFAEAVTRGLPSPVPWTEARAALGIIDALYASAREGREIVPPG